MKLLMAALSALPLTLAACGTGTTAGTPVASAATAAGAVVAGPFGALAGALAGPFVEDYLGERTLRQIGEAELQALGAGRPVSWRAGDVAGTIVPGEAFVGPEGQTCRAFVEHIQLPDGRTVSPAGTACQTEDGLWVIV